MSIQLRERIDASPMSFFQWSAVGICVLLNVLDGFDVLVMAFTASGVSDEWQISASQLGLLLSAGLVGMALGSMFLAPFADRIGRRAMILICLVVSSGGMFLSAASQDATQLGLTRLLTGVGIGGILASSNVIAAEYANARWRGLAVSLNSTGYAIGATAGGVVAAVLQQDGGWRSVFLFGAIATALLIPAVLWRLPESLDFLLTQRSAGALPRLNRLLASMRQPTVEAMPAVDTPARRRALGKLQHILSPDMRRNTILTWAGFFMIMFGFYFVTSWTPKLLVEAGLSTTEGITGGVLLNLGGIFGTTLLGLLATRFALRNVLVAYTLLTAVLLAAFVPATSGLAAAFGVGVLIGLFINGCIAGLYALTPSIYAPSVRATGVGWAIGIGRIGAILSPVLIGQLLDASWSPTQVYLLVAVIVVLGGAAVRGLRPGGARTAKAATPAATSGSTDR
ncbi:MFS transporter [Qaidamihabitans albus]|uniref:MFS transporter n=1 Tax=Qaidamihabitans albus TaxID=2795733 RepID=UPI0018F1F698|nr:MFS transporter [Qaidamihabitans albus]